MQAAMSREESKGSFGSPALQRTMTMNYLVAYFEGPAMRLHTQVFPSHEKAIEFYKKVSKSSDTCIVIRGDEVIMEDSPSPANLNKLKSLVKHKQD